MLVNICMITYNHEAYIAQAIESILMQITSFDTRLIIGEDCGRDGTRRICMEYAERYPDKITLIPATENVGMLQNFHRTYRACTGKYIAFCEGDDYWTDEHKLQKQVDFLENNPSYSSCFHKVKLRTERNAGGGKEWIMHSSFEKDTFDTKDLLGPWFIASPSFVFVNYPDLELPDWFFNCRFGDLPFMLFLSLRGNIKLIDEVMAVYRQHDQGMSIAYKVYDKVMVMIYIYASFDIHTNYKFHETIRNSVKFEVDTHIPPRIVQAPTLWQKFIERLKPAYSYLRRVLKLNDKKAAVAPSSPTRHYAP